MIWFDNKTSTLVYTYKYVYPCSRAKGKAPYNYKSVTSWPFESKNVDTYVF